MSSRTEKRTKKEDRKKLIVSIACIVLAVAMVLPTLMSVLNVF